MRKKCLTHGQSAQTRRENQDLEVYKIIFLLLFFVFLFMKSPFKDEPNMLFPPLGYTAKVGCWMYFDVFMVRKAHSLFPWTWRFPVRN